jgi:hypothetical protein
VVTGAHVARSALLAAAAAVLATSPWACAGSSPSENAGSPDATAGEGSVTVDGSPEDAGPDASPRDAGHVPDAVSSSDAGDAATAFVPTAANAELIFTSPAKVATPPAWNANSPKLAGDDSFLYAVHTYFTDAVDTRFASIQRRPRAPAIGTGTWTEAARVVYPHQPPGIVMDTASNLHMVFDCLRPGTTDVTCFPGGAGTTGNTSRFYHLVFGTRDATGALVFDTYDNSNEWTAESNGYTGVGTTEDGVTYWSLADTSWDRVVQWSSGAMGGTVATLSAPGADLLYPIHGSSPLLGSAQLVLYAGEFDPEGGNNASYLASEAFSGNLQGLSLLFRSAPPTPGPGALSAFPSDVTFDKAGTLYTLSYLPSDGGVCTELRRFDGGLSAPPTVVPVGCASDYAKLQFSSAGTLYLFTDVSSGASLTVGVSPDRGDTWSWHTIPITGLPSNGDTQYHGFTPIKPYSSPADYDPDRFVFFFYGADASNGVENSYLGEIAL